MKGCPMIRVMALLLTVVIAPVSLAFGAGPGTPPGEMPAFPRLALLHLKHEDVALYYDPANSEVLTAKHPDAARHDEAGVAVSRALRTQLLGKGKGHFVIDADSGGSWDPGITVLQEKDGLLKPLLHIRGLRFALPGNGAIYVDGHNNTMFDVRRKYEWHDGTFVETRQPFRYVGLDTVTQSAIDLFSSRKYTRVIASLPKGAPVSVLLNRGSDYLVKTSFGLLGWIRIREGIQREESPIQGIYFEGD